MKRISIARLAEEPFIAREPVTRGLGVAIISSHAVTMESRLRLLAELAVVGFPLRRQWHLVYARDKRFGSVERAFLSFIDDGAWRSRLGELPLTE